MNRTILFFSALLVSIGVFAQTQNAPKLHIKTVTGTATYEIANVKRILMQEDVLSVDKKDKTASDVYLYDDVEKMFFEMSSGIEETKLQDSKLSVFSPAGSNTIYVKGHEAGKSYNVSIFALDGKLVYQDNNWCGNPVNVSGLEAGVYIFKINNSTIKFRK